MPFFFSLANYACLYTTGYMVSCISKSADLPDTSFVQQCKRISKVAPLINGASTVTRHADVFERKKNWHKIESKSRFVSRKLKKWLMRLRLHASALISWPRRVGSDQKMRSEKTRRTGSLWVNRRLSPLLSNTLLLLLTIILNMTGPKLHLNCVLF